MSDWKSCPWCSTSVSVKAKNKKGHRRGNGQGNVFKRGDTWTVRVTTGYKLVDGKAVSVRKTKGGFATKLQALSYARTLQETPQEKMCNDTFEMLYNKWYEQHEDRVGKSTMDCYKAAYKHFKPLHSRKFTTIVHTDLQECIDNCPAGKRTKENMKAFISLLYKFAMSNDIVNKNRAETLYTGHDATTTRPPFSMDQLRLIYGSNEEYKDWIIAMCYLGYRPSEMLNLTKESYNAERKCLVGGSKTEAGRDRIVTIPPFIQPIIEKRYSEARNYLFPMPNGGQMSENYFRKFVFNPIMQRLGVEGKTPYSCRHTYANLLKGVSGSDTDKASLMGHADASMTKYYQSADYDSLRRITDSLETL